MHGRLLPYRLPLKRPWSSAAGRFGERRGWLLELVDDEGRRGWGDCAPLPQAGTEDPRQAVAWLEQRLAGIEGQSAGTLLRSLPDEAPPAARCALETALLDLEARAAGRPLSRRLEINAAASVAVNASLGALDADTADRLADAAGFRVVKLKVGMAPPADDLKALERLANRLPPGVTLRLDANRAWNPEQARGFMEALDGLPIESLEEPLAEPSLEMLAELQATAPCPLALDESLGRFDHDRLLRELPVERLILKPMVLGGPLAALRLGRQALANGMECVVTTTVDSAIGAWAAVHLAAALNNGLAHGLATGDWLAEDVAPAPAIREGYIHLPDRPGLGIEPRKDFA
ncbi:o-succinylbenzoate synthase [Thiohalobacter sp. IOR34]|uniref:o-succinylbenzoate synthase n=1 Tax=Thiohalobacter sp. IOR34 TaxID=3057176 RepID=UPI0025B1E4BF|nr:o-succinylbenzoate synthase [Thiohalobacter sp. IOR34]WJW75970.1 o-succinylbenzoate synthase [Thiohalobacter sp. IOR34]